MDVSINQVWSLKEEPCRANNWKADEVLALLNTIKTNNLMKGYPSSTQLGQLVEPLLGYSRTAFQITGKLKNLRKSYLTCEKRGCTPAARRECPHYDTLAEVYGIEPNNDSDFNNVDNSEDVKITSKQGIDTMLSIIQDFNLAPDGPTRDFAPSAIRLISKMLRARGVFATTEQVKSALMDLRKSYVELRQKENNSIDHGNLRFQLSHEFWGPISTNDLSNDVDATPVKPKSESYSTKEKSDHWSDGETVVLLTSIKDLDLIDEASKNTEEAASKLKDVLKNSGYSRTRYQIQKKLDTLRNDYSNLQCAISPENAMKKFPFYALYKSVFNPNDLCAPDFCTSETIDELNSRRQSDDYDEDDSLVCPEKTKHSRSRSWSDDETILMLTLLKDLNLASLIAHRLSFEIACKVVGPMSDNGYTRSAMQIQIKLRNLRKSYYRCARAGFTSRAIADCPFYDKLNEMFKQPSDRKLAMVQKFERIDPNFLNSKSFNDHSYSNATSTIDKTRKSTTINRGHSDEDGSQHWLPVETICDESMDDGISADEDDEASGLEGSPEAEMLAVNANEEIPAEPENPQKQLTTAAGSDTGQANRSPNHKNPKLAQKFYRIKNENYENPGSSKKSADEPDVTVPPRGSKRKSSKLSSHKTKRVSAGLKSIRMVMAEVLRQEKLLQRKHHIWMERQFEIQRKHDREQRELLISEIRQFRKAVTTDKTKISDDCK